MEDAVVLAQCLRDIPDPTRAFAELERRRRPRVDRIFKQAQRNGSGKAMDSRLSEWFRDRLLPMFLRFGASSQTRSYAYRIPWTEPA
jgi:2-polyprenyl-6-methoxyphenol hydroxylase-like FAD-dependent oxidoreductase